MRLFIAVAILFFTVACCRAQSLAMEPGPKSPAESLKCIKVRHGFTVELMAAEPLVMDPIAFAWGPDGKFWVVEMGDYPLGVDGKNKFGGKVKFLEMSRARQQAADDAGPYTKATVFLDNLGYPTGVTPWGKGVIVTCAPDIFYAEDTNGDGKADKKIVLFTGFREGNQQHRVNGLVWGLDNWLHGANGDSGGVIKAINALERQSDGSHLARKLEKPGPGLNISGRDFRLRPETGEIEAVTGQTQFGRCRDDWGNWFGCNNSNPMYHFVLEDRYLKRNPHILYPDPKVNVSVRPGAAKVYPISKPLPRFNSPNAVNHFTSACSVMIYRDNLFGPEFYGNSFVAEPVHNLIHREVMKPKGVTFTSQRADDEQTSEFLASSDNWFRPTTIATGPDGALWIADMYRYVIEHPEWIPLDWQKKLALRAGHDMGRIYRVFPKDKTPRAIPRMDKMERKELAKALESPSGWVRDTAQHLLAHGPNDAKAVDSLRKVVKEVSDPFARLQALCTLDGIDAITVYDLVDALADEHPGVRKQAIQLSESRLGGVGYVKDMRIDKHLDDLDPQVRFQLACSLGACRDEPAGEFLARMLINHRDDRFTKAAVLSSLHKANWPGFMARLMKTEPDFGPEMGIVIKLASAFGSPRDVAILMSMTNGRGGPRADRFLALANVLDALEAERSSLSSLIRSTKEPELRAKMEALQAIFDDARAAVSNPKAATGDRLVALRLLGRGLGGLEADMMLLQQQLTPLLPEDVQVAATQQLGRIFDPRVPERLIAAWKRLSPTVRAQAIDVMLSRTEWTRIAIDAVDQRRILPSEIDTIRRQKLLDHRDPEIRRAAAKLFAAASNPDRAKLVSEYWITLPDKGDVPKGAKLFEKHCAACHQVAGIGQQVGPDFVAIGDKSPQGLLVAILDPNKAVEARYINYAATTKAGVTVSGLLQSETSTTITLVAADGKKHDLLRKDLDELASTGKSVMPEGFEKEIPPVAMADLIAFLRGNLAKPKCFPGNRPATVSAGADGSLKLLATNASIFGKTLIFEEKHKNLGYWSSPDDQAVWTIDIPKEGRYDLWIDYACETAGNSFVLQIGDGRLTHKVAGTASWELYRRVKIGTLRLSAGRHDAVMRAEGAIRGALIDLKEIQLVPASE